MGGLADASKLKTFNDFTAGSDKLESSPLTFNPVGWTAGKEFFTSFGDNDYFTPIKQLGPNGSFGFYYDSKNGRYQAAYKTATGNLIKDQEIPESILDQLSDNDIAKIFEKGGYNQNAYEENFSKQPYSEWDDAAKRFAISDYITAHFSPKWIKKQEISQTAKPLDPVKKEDVSQVTKTSDPVKTAASAQGSSDLKAIQAQYGPGIQKAYETGDATTYHNLQLAMKKALHDGKLWDQDSYIDPKGNLQKLYGIYGLEGHPEWEYYQKPNDASVSNAGGSNDKVSEVSDTKSGETSNTTQPIRDTKANTSILDYLMADKMLQDDRTAQLTKDKDIGLIPMLLAAYGMGKIM
jgi:hypothetical protein